MRNAEIKAEVTLEQVQMMQDLAYSNCAQTLVDHQVDIYYAVIDGRLKLRLGDIENYLVFYRRAEADGPKTSHYRLVSIPPEQREPLRVLLTDAFGEMARVDKLRRIFFIGHAKFHYDTLAAIPGRYFAEIEVRDPEESVAVEKLHAQLKDWMAKLTIKERQCIGKSYVDMVLESSPCNR